MMHSVKNRAAAIDIGTNSTRLLVADCDGRYLIPVSFYVKITRIGEGMTDGAGLKTEPVLRTIKALHDYRQLIEDYGAEQVRVVATSAVREAPNAQEFVERVKRETGFDVEIIKGEEEAYLSYLGACRSLPDIHCGTVVDIGGGSTEFTCQMQNGSAASGLCCISVPVGSVRLTEHPLLLSDLLANLKGALDKIKIWGGQNLIGVGGTITTLAAVDQELYIYDSRRIHGYRLSRTGVERILFRLAAKTNEERKNVPGLQPERADVIVAGTMILWAIMNYLERPEIVVSEADLLHGMIYEMQL